MKIYKIERIRKTFTQNASEDLRKETEEFLNRIAGQGAEIINVQFEIEGNVGHIYCFITYRL